MISPEKPILLFLILATTGIVMATAKSTIEPCSNNDTCNAMLGYMLYTDLKVSEVASLFQVDPIALLLANAIDISYPDVEHHILPARLLLKIPITCSCQNGIRKSVSTRYKTRPSDTLASIADSIYAGLVSADQLAEANSVTDPSVLDVGQSLVVPLPCTCFNGTDNSLPAIYLSYVTRDADTLAAIARRYSTTLTDLMDVNAMGNTDIKAGDILAVPLPACASKFPRYTSDHGLIVPNGTYAITADLCVQCSCGPASRNLYCEPASLAVSCSSMQCRNSNLMLGNITTQQSSAGCNVTTCSYNGFANGTILTTLSTSLQPRCPGPQQLPSLIDPPTSVPKDMILAPAPAPEYGLGGAPSPKLSMAQPGGSLPGFRTANGPAGSITSNSWSPVNSIIILSAALASCMSVFVI